MTGNLQCRAAMFLVGCVMFGALIGADGRQEIHAHMGQRADLQCVTPPTTISDWQRLFVQKPLVGGAPLVVYTFSEGRAEPQYQHRKFQNRTELSGGNVMLSLARVGPEDEGDYDCHIFGHKESAYQLIYEGRLTLSVRADYEPLQIGLTRVGAEISITCFAEGGYPKGHIRWKLPPAGADARNTTESWAERHPRTHLYNVFGRLNVTSPLEGSVACCVLTQGAELCSDFLDLTTLSRVKGQRGRGPVFIILALSVLLWSR